MAPTTGMLDSCPQVFTPGSTVKLTTALEDSILGKVVAFDYDTKLLVLRPDDPKQAIVVNVELCKEITILSHPDKETVQKLESEQLPALDHKKLDARAKRAVEERYAIQKNYRSSAGAQGVMLYFQLVKTFGQSAVQWTSGKNDDGNGTNESKCHILVRNSIMISPPFKKDCVTSTGASEKLPSESLKYVQTLVEGFWNRYG